MSLTTFKSAVNTPLFVFREYLHRRPAAEFDWHFVDGSLRDNARQGLETLKKEGIVIIPAYFKGDMLQRMREAFDRVVRDRPSPGNTESFGNTEFTQEDSVFLEAALDDFLLEMIGGYYQKRFALGRASALRLDPVSNVRYGSFLWHHDARGRQLHLMILLTDVPENGQRMSYLRRSQNRYYDYSRGLGEGSRFEREVVETEDAKDRIIDVVGPAGTVAVFDSNGLHTGNRNESARRDTLTFCYVSKKHFKKLHFRKQDVESLPQPKQRVVTFNPHVELVA